MKKRISTNSSFIKISKRILVLALPMAGNQFLNVASSFLSMAILAVLGKNVLAASALIFSTQVSIMVSGMSILFSLSILVGHSYGAKNYTAIGIYVQQSWILAILLSIPIMLFFFEY